MNEGEKSTVTEASAAVSSPLFSLEPETFSVLASGSPMSLQPSAELNRNSSGALQYGRPTDQLTTQIHRISPWTHSQADLTTSDAAQQASLHRHTSAPQRATWSLTTDVEQTSIDQSLERLTTNTSNPPSSNDAAVIPDTSTYAYDSRSRDRHLGESADLAFMSQNLPQSATHNNLYGQQQHAHQAAVPTTVKPLSDLSMMSLHQHSSQGDVEFQMPDHPLADTLVDAYFEHFHCLYPFIHEGTFRTEYENMWLAPDSSALRPSWYGLVNAVFAVGSEFCDTVEMERYATTMTTYAQNSRKAFGSQAQRQGNLELVQTGLLLCHYLQGTLDVSECLSIFGLTVGMAINIGLHLNPDSEQFSSVEKETRKRVWWGCFAIDRIVSMKFNRPTFIHLQDALNVPLPLPIDDTYLHPNLVAPRQPSGRPSKIDFFIHTIKLMQLIDDIQRNVYYKRNGGFRRNDLASTLDDARMSRLVILHARLLAWFNSKPDHLDASSRTRDSSSFEVQQAVLRIRYLQVLILLQRPLLLKLTRENIEDDLECAIAISGSQACLEAAMECKRLIVDQSQRLPMEYTSYNLHYLFTSIGVLIRVCSLERDKLNLIMSTQQFEISKILESGISSLELAGHHKALAARYTTALQQAYENLNPFTPAVASTESNCVASNLERPNHPSSTRSSMPRSEGFLGDGMFLESLNIDCLLWI